MSEIGKRLAKQAAKAAVRRLRDDPEHRRQAAQALKTGARTATRIVVEDFENDDFTRTKEGQRRFLGLARQLTGLFRDPH